MLFRSVVAGTGTDVNQTGVPLGGSRIIQWGWNPVGGASESDAGLTPNDLAPSMYVGTVTVTTT